jgi:predicted ATPase
MLRHCVVLGIEGTRGSGKTTVSYALAAHYRELGIRVTVVEEQARDSPFAEDVLAGRSPFDIEAGAGLYAAQMLAQLRAARASEMIICDTTTASVLAYAWLVLPAPPRSRAAGALAAMEAFCRVLAPAYDAVFYCCDRFRCDPASGPWRVRFPDLQPAADRVIRSTCATVGQRVIDLPPNMSTGHRVDWISRTSSAGPSAISPRTPGSASSSTSARASPPGATCTRSPRAARGSCTSTSTRSP